MHRVLVGLLALVAVAPFGCDAPADTPVDAAPDAPPSGAFPGCAPGDGKPVPVCASAHLCWVAPSTLGHGITTIGGSGCDYWLGGDAVYRMNGDTITPTDLLATVYDVHVFPSQVWIASEVGTRVFDGTTWRTLDGSVAYRVWGSAPDDVWVRRNFDIAHSTGSVLQSVMSLTSPILSAIWGTSPRDVRVIGEGNTILLWNGDLWWFEHLGTGSRPIDVWGTDDGHWYAVAAGAQGEAEIWQLAGSSWRLAYSEPAPARLDAVWGSSAQDVWAGGALGDHVMHFDGTQWSRVALPVDREVYAIHGTSSDDVVFGGDQFVARWDGTHIRMTTTSLVLAPGETMWTGMYGASGSDVWVVGDRGTTGHWDGTTWQASRIAAEPVDAFAIGGSSGSDIWIAGAAGSTMHVWHRAADGWTATDLPAPGTLRAITVAAPDDAWVAGDGGAIFHFDGATWTRTPAPTDETLVSVTGSSRDAWAAGSQQVLHWDGQAWGRIATDGSAGPFTAVWMRASNDVYLAGSATLYHFDGQRFIPDPWPQQRITSIGGGASLMWLTGDRAVMFDRGTGPVLIDAPQATWRAAYFPSRNDGWIAGSGGVVMRYRP